ncbi:MAG: hypothetical protein ACQERD_09890 [Campylobacterota bacterium]
MIITEGIFRKPRIRTNKILKRFAHLFEGDIINVSGSSDSDKECSLKDYYFGNYDNGKRYKDYFINAKSYTVSNYPLDETKYNLDKTDMIFLDLEKDMPEEYLNRFDVVYNHTVFEHIFDVFTAFRNLCSLSNDIVIFVVPQFQRIHDYARGYKDYWRFTPFAIDKLFEENDLTVIYRETTTGFSESMYLFYIATKNPKKWENKFPNLDKLEKYITKENDGLNYTLYSKYISYFDIIVRKVGRLFAR